MIHPDDIESFPMTQGQLINEAIRDAARYEGESKPDVAWLLSDWDTWVANPHYKGPPVPHPDAYDPNEIQEALDADLAAYEAEERRLRADNTEEPVIPF